jgi:hypothetical protein
MEDREHSKFECPNCHSGNIQQFELAYESGLSNLGLTTVGVGFGDDLGLGAGISGGSSQTMLSANWSPGTTGSGGSHRCILDGGRIGIFPAGRVPGLVFRRAAGAADLPGIWRIYGVWRPPVE